MNTDIKSKVTELLYLYWKNHITVLHLYEQTVSYEDIYTPL